METKIFGGAAPGGGGCAVTTHGELARVGGPGRHHHYAHAERDNKEDQIPIENDEYEGLVLGIERPPPPRGTTASWR